MGKFLANYINEMAAITLKCYQGCVSSASPVDIQSERDARLTHRSVPKLILAQEGKML